MSSPNNNSNNTTTAIMLRVLVELGKADFNQVFRYPLPPNIEGYSSFVEASLDLSTIFCKVITASASSSSSDKEESSSASSYSLLEFEDDVVAMLMNCVCFHRQSSEYGAFAVRLLTNSLPSIFDRAYDGLMLSNTTSTTTTSSSSCCTTRKWLTPNKSSRACRNGLKSQDDASNLFLLSDSLSLNNNSSTLNEDAAAAPAVSSQSSNNNDISSNQQFTNIALKAVCLDAFHYLAGCDGFKSIVGNDKLTSSPNSIIGCIYSNTTMMMNESNNNNNKNHYHLPPRSLVELYNRINNDIWNYYSSVDEVARDVQLLIQTALAGRQVVAATVNSNNNSNNTNHNNGDLQLLLQLRLVHCHKAFKVALERFKKSLLQDDNDDEDNSNNKSSSTSLLSLLPPTVLDAITLHNCPIQKGLVEKPLSKKTKELLEKSLNSSSSSVEEVLNSLKVITSILIDKDATISNGGGVVSFPLFDDNLLNFVSSSSSPAPPPPHSLYLLQCQLITGQLPQTMMELLSSSSNNSSNKNKFDRKDLVWKTIKGEVEKIITQIVARYGVEHQFSNLGETFRKQLHALVSEYL